MTANALQNLAQIEASLWEAADQLRANSNLNSSEYCLPVLGVIFLRHASNRYQAALTAIQADQASGKMAKRPLDRADFIKRRALMLPEADVKHAGLYITDFKQTYSDAGLEQSKLWPAGTLCITIAANIADTAIGGCQGSCRLK
ncbi:type I restriction-modification system subunit M N-terminal domain-containing protein [Polaromonas sp. CG_9.5]|uniref:type I restriction-modification system subunit M N-terminal domain-containing protein n=1 Tax=Polaromonas sp. CG_9.5 TaxID=3071705 RepID=UPI002E0D1DAF